MKINLPDMEMTVAEYAVTISLDILQTKYKTKGLIE